MEKLTYLVDYRLGIHARPAALLAQLCVKYQATVTMEANGKVADGSNVLQILALKAALGDTLIITAEGAEEKGAYPCAAAR